MDAPIRPRLSAARARELRPQVKRLRAQGLYHAEIAEQLGVSAAWVQRTLAGMPAPPRPKPIPHGRPSGWMYHRCDCETCRAGRRAYESEVRARMLARGKITRPHGTLTAYNQGCRCSECRTAAAAATKARNAATRAGATRHRREWTKADAEVAFRTDISIRERARLLGRTYAAVDSFLRSYPRGDDPFGVFSCD